MRFGQHTAHAGDCVAWLESLPPGSLDAVVCDPPYLIGFMGKAWDNAANPVEWHRRWLRAAFRAAKPGAHLIAFSATRAVHWLATAAELEGWELRDMLSWVYFEGMPKGLDVSKALDKAAGAERKVVGRRDRYRDGRTRANTGPTGGDFLGLANGVDEITAPATEAAHQWNGWNTNLKPCVEPAILARKPLDGTVINNVLTHGVGGLNIDACRFAPGDSMWLGPDDDSERRRNAAGGDNGICGTSTFRIRERRALDFPVTPGRYPANIIHTSKASPAERAGARHVTVKPLRLMRWLVRLVTPPGGVVCDPFLGSGTTMLAAEAEGFTCIGAEREPAHLDDIALRWSRLPDILEATKDEGAARRVDAKQRGQVSLFGDP